MARESDEVRSLKLELQNARKEIAHLHNLVKEFKARFDQLTPDQQAAAMNYLYVLGVVMYSQGLTDVSVDAETVNSMPRDRVVAFGDENNPEVLRVRLMSPDQAVALARKLDSLQGEESKL